MSASGSTPFGAEVSPDGGTVVLAGDLDEAALAEVVDLLARLEITGGVVDLSGLTFITSRAVAAIALASMQATRVGRHLTLVAAPATIAAAVLTAVAIDFDSGPRPPQAPRERW